MAVAMTGRPSWPSGPTEAYNHDDDHAQNEAVLDEGPAQAVIGEMARLLQDTRSNMLTGGCVLGAITVGIAIEVAFPGRSLRSGALDVLSTGLFSGLLLCWLRTLALLAQVGRPVLEAVSQLRWETGAPLDPRASWLTLPAMGTKPKEWTWTRAHLLLSAARLTRYRIQRADTWTYVTAAGFLVWTAVNLLGR